MKIEQVEFALKAPNMDRISLMADAIMKMGVKLPHIVTSLALMTEFSPYRGNMDLYDVGFHAYWEWDGFHRVNMELTLTES